MAVSKRLTSRFEKQLRDYVREKSKLFAVDLSADIAEAFVSKAKNKLLKDATPKDSSSQQMVNSLADSIHIEQNKSGKIFVVVPRDPEGLNMYLEYGTGLKGESNPNPDARKIGWKYAIHKDRYLKKNGEPIGFIFKKKGTYLDEDDKSPSIRKIRGKDGEPDKIISYENKVFSAGLTPVRYIYSTRVYMNRLIGQFKNKKRGYLSLRRRLREIKNM